MAQEQAQNFDRNTFHRLDSVECSCNVNQDWQVSLAASMPGAFEILFCSSNTGEGENTTYTVFSSINFIVDPLLSVQQKDGTCIERSLSSLKLQTLLTPNIGPTEHWEISLCNTLQGGFNAIHLSPVQRLGSSNSAYSIQDHLALSDSLFTRKKTNEQKYQDLSTTISEFRSEHNVLFFVDVVLNHLSTDSLWLSEHPDIGYNLANTPWLRASVELDDTILSASSDFVSTKEEEFIISDIQKLEGVYKFWENDVLPGAKLWEFFILESETHAKRLWDVLQSSEEKLRRRFQGLLDYCRNKTVNELVDLLFTESILVVFTDGRRYPVDFKKRNLFRYLNKTAEIDPSTHGEPTFDHTKEFINSINLYFYKQYDADIQSAKTAVWNSAQHIWLTERAGKGALNENCPLVPLYFARVPHAPEGTTDGSVTPVYSEDSVFACNGFIWNGDPSIDFCLPSDTQDEYKTCLTKELHTSNRRIRNDTRVLIVNGSSKHRSLHGLVTSTSRIPASCPYFSRQLVIWGDCVRFRYGLGSRESPHLWEQMKKYVELMAKTFDGFRIDNAHGQSIHVLRFLLDAARKVNSSLHINAELFTGSAVKDIEYISNIGINSLVREAMQTTSVKQLSQAVGQYSERPIGDLLPPFKLLHLVSRQESAMLSESSLCMKHFANHWNTYHSACPFTYRTPSIFYDCTHDNEVAGQVGSAGNTLAIAALTTASGCASGSTKGVDCLPLKNVSVVNEERLYHPLQDNGLPSEDKSPEFESCASLCEKPRILEWNSENNGVVEPLLVIRRLLNALKQFSDSETMCEVHSYVAPGNDDIVVVNRYSPFTGRMLWYIIRFGSFRDDKTEEDNHHLATFHLEGNVTSLVLTAKLKHLGKVSESKQSNSCLQGISGALSYWYRPLNSSLFKDVDDIGNNAPSVVDWNCGRHKTNIELDRSKFPSGSVIVLAGNSVASSWLPFHSKPGTAVKCLEHSCMLSKEAKCLDDCINSLDKPEMHLTMNYLLYTSETEERDSTEGEHGVYVVPGIGSLPWCGLAGLQLFIREAVGFGELDHPLCTHFRNGLWYFDYLQHRVSMVSTPWGENFKKCIERITKRLETVPVGVRPRMAFQLLYYIYWKGVHASSEHMMEDGNQNKLIKLYSSDNSKCHFLPYPSLPIALLASTNIFYRRVPSNPLLDARNIGEHPLRHIDPASICAGIEHFATGIMRNWGRDTFISLRGLMIVTGRKDVAESTLLAYGSVVRHGLIPNLLDSGRRPRYNSRDATWFWLGALEDYCNAFGYEILEKTVPRLFPTDLHSDYKWHHGRGYRFKNFPDLPVMRIKDVVLEIIDKHASGIEFKEWDAGPAVDEKMQQEGFHVKAWIDSSTGLLYGGNRWNCGTWMDKMGESEAFGNFGVPATPRDGAAVELNGLLFKFLKWMTSTVTGTNEIVASRYFARDDTTLGCQGKVSFERWKDMLLENFGRLFADKTEICGLRDLVQPTLEHTSTQLRPNQVREMRVLTSIVSLDFF